MSQDVPPPNDTAARMKLALELKKRAAEAPRQAKGKQRLYERALDERTARGKAKRAEKQKSD